MFKNSDLINYFNNIKNKVVDFVNFIKSKPTICSVCEFIKNYSIILLSSTYIALLAFAPMSGVLAFVGIVLFIYIVFIL